jgi:hypothetical protein
MHAHPLGQRAALIGSVHADPQHFVQMTTELRRAAHRRLADRRAVAAHLLSGAGMRILILCHAFNSLSQRLYSELAARGHALSVEFDIADSVAEEAVALFRPELIVAPYLRRAIPASIWRQQHCCLIVHPGIVGDRGPSALDWAIQDGEREWGVTVLQATGELDAARLGQRRSSRCARPGSPASTATR